MAEEVNLEPRRFAAAASHYLAGRPAYAERLILRIVQKLPLGAADAVMDLGCGPGQLAILFAPYVGSVLAIDPSAEMLEIARHAAGEAAKIRFKPGSSFDIGPELGTFKLVTIGRAFHWMDRSDTLQRLDGMVAKGGAVALFADFIQSIAPTLGSSHTGRSSTAMLPLTFKERSGTPPIGLLTRKSCLLPRSLSWNGGRS